MADAPLEYQDLLALLRGEEMNAFEAEVAAALGTQVVPGWGDSTALHRELKRSQTSAAFLARCFAEEREAFRAFVLQMSTELRALPDEEEYPPGEEPDPDDPSPPGEVLGYMQGFSLLYAQYYRFFRSPDDALLDDWLKYRRTPHRARFRRDLKRIFAGVRPADP